jgi:Kef-type K+ transport system membrane component KefB
LALHDEHVLAAIAFAIVAATLCGLAAKALRQPLILGYLLAGVAVGPEMGLGLVADRGTIALIAEIGLILLLFMIGLEMDLQKLMGAGRALTMAGVLQFPLGLGLGLLAALGAGVALGGGKLDALYVAVAMALSSTMIVVKLLYDKNELNTTPGRITLGILVFQDVWAILFLALQPTLLDPRVMTVAVAAVKAVVLVAASLALSRFVLPRVFAFVAKVPELLLVCSLAWCFLVSGTAAAMGLSKEMGALVAGVGMSTFPYNLDVVAKVTNIRDFFVTLFFVALGMQIPRPTGGLLAAAAGAALFLAASRAVIVPILYLSGAGLRSSLIPAINLAQMSEFSLVIAALGAALGHVGTSTVGLLTLVFALTAVASTYLISHNHAVQGALAALLRRLGVPEVHGADHDDAAGHLPSRPVVFLGFFRDTSSIVEEFETSDGSSGDGFMREVMVIDFNPAVLGELHRRQVACVYGDVAHMDTLHHVNLHAARVIVSTLTDAVLRGTTNLRLLRKARRLAGDALFIGASDTLAHALVLYAEGADFVYLPRLHSAEQIAQVIRAAFEGSLGESRAAEIDRLKARREVMA